MKYRLLTIVSLLLAVVPCRAQHDIITSPDGALTVTLDIIDGQPCYQVSYNGHTMLRPSPLGFVADVGDFGKKMRHVKTQRDSLHYDYQLHWSKTSHVRASAARMVYHVVNEQGNECAIEFRVGNHDVAFRYLLPQGWNSGETTCAVIQREHTSFCLPNGTTTFLTPQAPPMSAWKRTHPAYEEEYLADQPLNNPSKYGCGYTFPCLFRVGEAGWLLISETGVRSNYCASHLSECGADGRYTIAFPHPGENNGNGTASPGVGLPECTPWRTITVGATLQPIVETTVPFDVVEPLYEPSRVYQPGRATWSWIMWQDSGTNYDDQVRYIDLAHNLGWEYVLVDAGWDVTIGRERMKLLSDYARSQGVKLFLWYNSSRAAGDAKLSPYGMDNSIDRKREMRWLEQAGIAGIKVDFFGGDKQETMRLYEDILTEANDHGLMVIFHGCTLPRGWERMFPNFVSCEAVLASENLYFQDYFCQQEAFNACLHPFIRNAVGAMDFGGTILNTRMSRDNAQRHGRVTGDGFQIATAVLFQTAVQNFALTPDNLTTAPAFVIDFMRQVPTTWDETRLLDGYPGRYVVLARRHGHTWYVAGINAGPDTRKVRLSLSTLAPTAGYTMIADQRGKVIERHLTPNRRGEVDIEIPADGGFVIYSDSSIE